MKRMFSWKNPLVRLVWIAFIVTFRSLPASADPIARFDASRTGACTAPCAVFFDAHGNGSDRTVDPDVTRPFHVLDYKWSFGDDANATWQYSGKSKNHATGPIAAHLYERPGNYQVTLSVTSPRGKVASTTATIAVDDPEIVYANGRTTCVSVSGNFDGCPGGALRVQSGDFDASVANADGRRTLFRSGEEFSFSGVTLVTAATRGSTLGAFGAGPKPIVRWTAEDAILNVGGDDWRITNLDLRGVDTTNTIAFYPIQNLGAIRRLTLFEVDLSNHLGCVGLNQASGSMNQEIFGIDIECRPTNNRNRAIFDKGQKTAWLGLHLDATHTGLNGYRCTHLNKAVIQHSLMEVGDGGSVLSIRSTPTFPPTRYLVISDNRFVSGSVTAPIIRHCVEGGCLNDGSNSGQDNLDSIYERNFFAYSVTAPNGVETIQLAGGEQTIRNNIFDLNGVNSVAYAVLRTQFELNRTTGAPINEDNTHVYNNTIYSPHPLESLMVCNEFNDSGANDECRNNLVYAPNAGVVRFASGTHWATSNNISSPGDFTGNPFVRALGAQGQTRPNDFRLSGAVARPIDAGFDLSSNPGRSVLEDHGGSCRPRNNAWDVGAYEFEAGGSCSISRPAAPILLP